MTIYMHIATIAWLCFVLGFLKRRNKRAHIPLVSTGLVLDIALVFYLQVTRSAVQTAASFTLSPLSQLHILFSSCALLLYFPMIFLGIKLNLGTPAEKTRLLHRRIGALTLILRSLGFGFMFSLIR